jgi:hypothetical protein
VLDFEEWMLNLTEANADPANPRWLPLYESIKAEYGMPALTPATWNNLIERFKTDDTLFAKYVR